MQTKKFSAKKTDLNGKTTEIENKIPSITGLATNSALTVVENKLHDASSLVTKTIAPKYQILKNNADHNHDHNHKYITTSEFNKLTTGNFKARLVQADIVTKTDFGT